MNKLHSIPMVDLGLQYQTMQAEIDEAIRKVIDSQSFIKGEFVEQFESHLQEYLHVKHVIGVSSGTSALYLALLALQIGEGDEVIVPSFTFVATAEVVALVGAKPVFADVDWETMNIDVSDVERKITPKTKAIIPVHLFGLGADMQAILALANEHNLAVVEDACQAMGSKCKLEGEYKHAGTLGKIGCTSFFPSKNLGCYGDGGAVFTDDDALANLVRSLANHGMGNRKYHSEQVGINSRLNTLQAAILDVKLRHLDTCLQKRRQVAKNYEKALQNEPHFLLPKYDENSHSFHQYTLRIVDFSREKVQKALSQAGIASAVYYPEPIHLQPAYAFLGYKKGDLPVTEKLCDSVLSLPMYPELTEQKVAFICEKLVESLTL